MLRGLIERAVDARGALTESGVVEHCRLRGGVAGIRDLRRRRWSLRARLQRLEVADGGAPVLRTARGSPARGRGGAVLLSPFDNLLWDRPFAERVLGFRHLIEVYKPAPERCTATTSCRWCVGDRGRRPLPTSRPTARPACCACWPGTPSRGAVRPARDEALERAFARLARQLVLAPRARRPPQRDEFETRAIHAGQEPGSAHRRGDGADLPDVDVRPGGGRRAARATTTRARPTRPATRSSAAWRRSRAPSTGSRSRPGWPRRPRSCTCSSPARRWSR